MSGDGSGGAGADESRGGSPGAPGPGRAVGRSGLTSFEAAVTVLVAVLVVAGLAALVPLNGRDGGSPTSGAAATGVVRMDDAELAAPRAQAALQPCPAPPAGATARAAEARPGKLAGIEVPCLGAPGTVDLAAALGGRETLLNVWAAWCAPCREELPTLQAYAARPDAVPVLGVNLGDNPVRALELLTRLGIHLPMVVDSGQALADRLRFVALPASYLVRPDGGVTKLLPQVAYAEPSEVADAVAAARARVGG